MALAVLLAGCSPPHGGSGEPSSAAASGETQHVEIPVAGTALPAGYHIDSVRSLILGEGESWTGRLVIFRDRLGR
ncbi:MAG: hypothetical protein ACLQJR_29255 [Stellaceae bacterium]